MVAAAEEEEEVAKERGPGAEEEQPMDGRERALSRSKTTAISEGQSARSRRASERARNLRATWIRAAFNPTVEPAIMKLGLG